MNSRLILALLVLLPGLCVSQTIPPTSPSGPSDPPTLLIARGRVVQDPGGQPLRKVDVRFTSRNDQKNEQYTASTDAEGKFQIEDLKPGRYSISLEHPGFVQLDVRGSFGAKVTLQSAEDAKNLVLRMQAAAVIAGKVVDDDGDPIPNVSVQASAAGLYRPGLSGTQGFSNTNDLGEFRIAGLRPGKYLLLATASGRPPVTKRRKDEKDHSKGELNYVPTYYPGTIDKSQAGAIELRPGDESPVSFSPLASPTFFIRGTVAKPAGSPFAQMMLRAQDGRTVQAGGGPAADGSFEFRDLLPGSYTAYLMVFDPSVLAEVQQNRTPQMQMMRLGQPIEITNANIDGLRLVPETAGRVRGRFRMDKGEKIDWTQLSVVLTPDDASLPFAAGTIPGGLSIAQAKADGSFDLPNVAAREYRLAITSNSNTLQDYFTKAVNLDGKDVADSGFAVSGGVYSLDVVISAGGGILEGTVVDAKGKPVPDATVLAAPNGERRKRFDVFGQDTSDPQGHFRLRGLIAGEYTVLAWEDLEENVRDPEVLKTYQERGEKVQIEEGTRTSVSVKVIPFSDETP
jgi:protocatechuate 3,4-dioxygenase beta subunit